VRDADADEIGTPALPATAPTPSATAIGSPPSACADLLRSSIRLSEKGLRR
jgi:hypothetical protein